MGWVIRFFDLLFTCNGLNQGWYVIAEQETWYGPRKCGKRINPLLLPIDFICLKCLQAHHRRGMRLSGLGV